MMKRLSDLGERSFIRALRERFPMALAGDDAAVLDSLETPVVTTDSFFQGTHFHLWWSTPEVLASRLLEAALSDLAAMGASPKAIFSAVVLPSETELDWVMGFYHGLTSRKDCPVAGGETIRGGEFGITLTAVGDCGKKTPFLRSGAKPGDTLWTTGPLGRTVDSPALLDQARSRELSASEHRQTALFLKPSARFDAVPVMRRAGCRCAIDISDGLFSECAHIGRESGVGIELELERVPLVPYCGERVLEACSAGEDFELLFTIPEGASSPFHRIGRITGSPGLKVMCRGVEMRMDQAGYDHFR